MFFSVSIACFNAEKYIDRCIKSIMNQTEKDFELIIVDDGSTDKSLEICQRWEKKYPEIIRVFKSKNQGSLLARRKCFSESKGRYIYILDADDYIIKKSFLFEAKEKIIKSKCDMIFFNATSNENHKPLFDYNFNDGDIIEKTNLKLIYQYIIRTKSFNQLWTKIFKREIIDFECDYSKYSFVSCGTDAFQMIPIVFNCNRIMYWDSVEYYYQVDNNESSIVHKFNPCFYESVKETYKRLYTAIHLNKSYDKEVEIDLKIRWLKTICSAVYKIRLTKVKSQKIQCLEKISNDKLFREYYIDKNSIRNKLSIVHKIILKLLYNHRYNCLIILVNLISIARKRRNTT